MKKEIIVEAINDHQEKLYDWIEENKAKLKYVSKDTGCGCCVSIIKIEGDKKIIETFPKNIELN